MPALPDVGPLGSLAGWAVAVVMLTGVLTLIVLGKLVPGPAHDREVQLRNAAEKRLDEQSPILREQGEELDRLTASMEFLVDFVKAVALDRRDRGA